MTVSQARTNASKLELGGYSDWRLPTIKELYSLMDFSGKTGRSAGSSKPYLNTKYFDFEYGDPRTERFIDAQYLSSTKYVSTTMWRHRTVFGVNFADGRIKGYGYEKHGPRGEKTFFVRYVRGKTGYGRNAFVNNGNGTVTDRTTGLMWMQIDSGALKAGPQKNGGMNWQQTLEWADNLTYAGYSDWRLPNAKELQGIVDYNRSPDTTNSPAINPIFKTSKIRDQQGKINYPYYWTGTTHVGGPGGGSAAVYVAFGEAQGWMKDRRTHRVQLLDVHGAGAQRSDPKAGNPNSFPRGRGPQGDVILIENYVRCVRNTR